MPYDSSCIFCKIARGEIPCAGVLETPEAVVFLDIGPLNPGHLLVVPREHYATLSDLPDALAASCASYLPRLCRALTAATAAEGLNILVNHGAVAGQSVHHVHWHIIPRHRGDHLHWPWPAGRYAEGQLPALQAQVREALAQGE